MATYLYHGSIYEQQELMPGFQRSGELVKWDETESNRFLYATTDYQEAIRQALAAHLDKTYRIKRYQSTDKTINVTFENISHDIDLVNVYVYKILFDKQDGWIRNHNTFNKLTTEYKTDHVIRENLIERVPVHIGEWRKENGVTITFNNQPKWIDWK